jgi:hypothetical protein
MDDNMAVTEPLTHGDGSPVTVEDVEASQLRQEMLDLANAMRGVEKFVRELHDEADMRLAERMRRIMMHYEPDSYTWEEWVQNRLYPQ